MLRLWCTDLHEDHGRNLLGREGLGLAEVLNLDDGIAALVNDLEGPGLSILLHDLLVESATNQTPKCCQNSGPTFAFAGFFSLDIEDGVLRVHSSLVLGGLTDQTLLSAEGDERGCREVTLLVGNDLDVGALIIGNAGVSSACIGDQSVARSNSPIFRLNAHSPRSMPMAPS